MTIDCVDPSAPADEPLDFENLAVLIDHPVRLRAAAAALAMVVNGERPSLTRVAELTGVSRQALHQGHHVVVRLVNGLRVNWQAPSDTPHARLLDELAAAKAESARQSRLRKAAEGENRRLRHHLELSDATVHALREPDTNTIALPPLH